LDFSAYLKLCRQNLHFTQKELVSELYKFDSTFSGLDINALGRWERAFTKPPLFKQVKILEYFFEKFNYYFPFLEMDDVATIEKQFSIKEMKQLLGKNKQIVMSFPSSKSDNKNFAVNLSHKSSHMDTAFSTSINICEEMYGADQCNTKKTLKAFSLSPRSLFLVCEYKEQYFGHCFFICLKTEVYHKIMTFQMDYLDISIADLARGEEDGSYLSVSLFAMNEKALALMFIRFYAYLILNQKINSHIGALISEEDAIEIATNFGLKKGAKKDDLMAYFGTIKDVLLTEQIIKILFSPNSLPEG
jgi:transcriptional regulator with XRE-family HTH domain